MALFFIFALMIVVVASRIFAKGFIGMAVYPFIFVRSKELKNNKTLLNHEKIHLRQQIELLWIFFFIWYLVEFLILLIRYKNFYLAYQNISFEKEAHTNDSNQNYLECRRFWAFINYLK